MHFNGNNQGHPHHPGMIPDGNVNPTHRFHPQYYPGQEERMNPTANPYPGPYHHVDPYTYAAAMAQQAYHHAHIQQQQQQPPSYMAPDHMSAAHMMTPYYGMRMPQSAPTKPMEVKMERTAQRPPRSQPTPALPALPKVHFKVYSASYDSFTCQENEFLLKGGDESLSQSPGSTPHITDSPIEWTTACDVCLAYEPLADLSTLSSQQLFVLGRNPRQTHQCYVCGALAHRVCYGISRGVFDLPVNQDKKILPDIPVIQSRWERPRTTKHCKFLCDLCEHVGTVARRGVNCSDILSLVPLRGNCILCGGRQGPRKLVRVDRVEDSLLPEFCFAHTFCILTCSKGVCSIPNWKQLTDIVVNERVLLENRMRLIPYLKGAPPVCSICRSQSSVGLALELCKKFRHQSNEEEDRCLQLFHPLCWRMFLYENDQLRDPTYTGGFQACITSRSFPFTSEIGKTIAFGSLSCLAHSFSEANEGARKISCGAHCTHFDTSNPQWSRCVYCSADLHARCFEKFDGKCSRCFKLNSLWKFVEEEWCLSDVSAEIGVARFRLSCERFTRAYEDTLSRSTRTMVPDSLVGVLSSLFFNQEWKTPIGISLQAYLLLKTTIVKRQNEWLSALDNPPPVPENCRGVEKGHVLLTDPLPSLRSWVDLNVGRNEVVPLKSDSTKLKRRIVMRKQQQTSPAKQHESDDASSSTVIKENRVKVDCTDEFVFRRTVVQKKRSSATTEEASGSTVGTKRRKKVKNSRSDWLLSFRHSLFSVLLLLSLTECLPKGSLKEEEITSNLKTLVYKAIGILNKVLEPSAIAESDMGPGGIRELVRSILLRAEYSRRFSLRMNRPLSEEIEVCKFTGAGTIRSLMSLSCRLWPRVVPNWLKQSDEAMNMTRIFDPKSVMLLSMSLELEYITKLAVVIAIKLIIMDIVLDTTACPTAQICDKLTMKDLKMMHSIVQEHPDFATVVDSTDLVELGVQIRRFDTLFMILANGVSQPLSIFDKIERLRELPYPFFSSLAGYFNNASPCDSLPSSLVPPPLIFHLVAPTRSETQCSSPGPISLLHQTLRMIEASTLECTRLLSESPVQIDQLKILVDKGYPIPADAIDLHKKLHEIQLLVNLAAKADQYAAELLAANAYIEFKKFMMALTSLEVQNLPPEFINLSHKMTSSSIQQHLILIENVDRWLAKVAEVAARPGPVHIKVALDLVSESQYSLGSLTSLPQLDSLRTVVEQHKGVEVAIVQFAEKIPTLPASRQDSWPVHDLFQTLQKFNPPCLSCVKKTLDEPYNLVRSYKNLHFQDPDCKSFEETVGYLDYIAHILAQCGILIYSVSSEIPLPNISALIQPITSLTGKPLVVEPRNLDFATWTLLVVEVYRALQAEGPPSRPIEKRDDSFDCETSAGTPDYSSDRVTGSDRELCCVKCDGDFSGESDCRYENFPYDEIDTLTRVLRDLSTDCLKPIFSARTKCLYIANRIDQDDRTWPTDQHDWSAGAKVLESICLEIDDKSGKENLYESLRPENPNVAAAILILNFSEFVNEAIHTLSNEFRSSEAVNKWLRVVNRGLALMTSASAESYIQIKRSGNIRIPWSEKDIFSCMARGVSILSVYIQPVIDRWEGNDLDSFTIDLYNIMSLLLPEGREFERAAYKTLRKRSWSARKTAALDILQKDMEFGSRSSEGLETLISIIKEGGPQDEIDECLCLFQEMSIRLDIINQIVPWLRNLAKPSDVFATETLMTKLIMQKIKSVTSDDDFAERVACELYQILKGRMSYCQSLRQNPQRLFLFRTCKITSKMLFSSNYNHFDIPQELVAGFAKGSYCWHQNTWVPVAANTIAPTRTMKSSVKGLYHGIVVDALSNFSANPKLQELFFSQGTSIGPSDTVNPSHLVCIFSDSRSDWVCLEMTRLPWNPIIFTASTQGVATVNLNGEITTEEAGQKEGVAPPVNEELADFVSICTDRELLFRGLLGFTAPKANKITKINRDLAFEDVLTRFRSYREPLILGIRQSKWLVECIETLSSDDRDYRTRLEHLALSFGELKIDIIGRETEVPSVLEEILVYGPNCLTKAFKLQSCADLLIGGTLALELRRALALMNYAENLKPFDILGLQSAAVALNGTLRVNQLPDSVQNAIVAPIVEDIPPFMAQEKGNSRGLIKRDEAETDLQTPGKIFFSSGSVTSTVEVLSNELREFVDDLTYVEEIIRDILNIALSPEPRDGLEGPAGAILSHICMMLSDSSSDTTLRKVESVKLVWSSLVNEAMLVAVKLDHCKIKFLHPLVLLAITEVIPISDSFIDCTEMRVKVRGLMNRLDDMFELPKTLKACLSLLALRLSITRTGTNVPYEEALRVLNQLESISDRTFPAELIETVRNFFSVKLSTGAVHVQFGDSLSFMENLKATLTSKYASIAVETFDARNSFITTHPANLCLFDFTAFKHNLPAYQNLLRRVESNSGISEILQEAENLIRLTRVDHPVFETMAMEREYRQSMMMMINSILVPYRNKCISLLSEGQTLFDSLWRKMVTVADPALSNQRPPPPAEILFHFWDTKNLFKVKSCLDLNLLKSRIENCQPSPSLKVLETFLQYIQRTDGLMQEVLADTKSQKPLSAIGKFYCLPPLPNDVVRWISSPIPEFMQLLGCAVPFGLVDFDVWIPSIEVAKTISVLTIFLIRSGLQAIEMHEVLFYGSNDVTVTNEESIRINQNLPPGEDKRSSPIWKSSMEKLLNRMVNLSVIMLNLMNQEAPLDLEQFKDRIKLVNELMLTDYNDEWCEKIYSENPRIWNTIMQLLDATSLPRIVNRCVWELVVTLLPCKGDPFAGKYCQPILWDEETRAFFLPAMSSTVGRLLTMGKNIVRDNAKGIVAIDFANYPPCLHLSLQALTNRERRPQIWISRCERLLEMLKSNLQLAKYIVNDARVSPENFISQISRIGVFPSLVLNEDMALVKTKLEAKFGVKIETADSVGLNSNKFLLHKPVPGESLRQAEIHRILWLSRSVGPSILKCTVSKKTVLQACSQVSPEISQWVLSEAFPRCRNELIRHLRAQESLDTSLLNIYDLIMKIVPNAEQQDGEDTAKMPLVMDEDDWNQDIYTKIFLRNEFIGHPFLLLLLAHQAVAPFPIDLLQCDKIRSNAKVSPNLIMTYSSFATQTNCVAPYGDQEALISWQSAKVGPLLAVKRFSDSTGLFASTTDSFAYGNPVPETTGVQVTDYCRLLPELEGPSGQRSSLTSEEKLRIVESFLPGCLWWGPLVSVTGNSPLDNYAVNTIMRPTCHMDSQALEKVMKMVNKFVKFSGSACSLQHYHQCLLKSPDSADMCPGGREFAFAENADIVSAWARIPIDGNFTRTEDVDIGNLDNYMTAVLPLKIPVVILADNLTPLIGDIIPKTYDFCGCQETGASKCPLARKKISAKVVADVYSMLRFDADLGRQSNIKVSLFVSLSDRPLHSTFNTCFQSENVRLRSPDRLALFGSLWIYDSVNLNNNKQLSTRSEMTRNFLNEPPAESLTLRDSAEAGFALKSVVESLAHAQRELQDRQPLLATEIQRKAPLPQLIVPKFRGPLDNHVQNTYYLISKWQCPFHSQSLALLVDDGANITLFRDQQQPRRPKH